MVKHRVFRLLGLLALVLLAQSAGFAEGLQAQVAEHPAALASDQISATVTLPSLADSTCNANTCGAIRRNPATNLLQVCMCR